MAKLVELWYYILWLPVLRGGLLWLSYRYKCLAALVMQSYPMFPMVNVKLNEWAGNCLIYGFHKISLIIKAARAPKVRRLALVFSLVIVLKRALNIPLIMFTFCFSMKDIVEGGNILTLCDSRIFFIVGRQKYESTIKVIRRSMGIRLLWFQFLSHYDRMFSLGTMVF